MDRQQHLEWAKKRAHESLASGGPGEAMASMASDLRNHPELESHAGIQLGMMLLMSGNMATDHDARKFIDGFN